MVEIYDDLILILLVVKYIIIYCYIKSGRPFSRFLIYLKEKCLLAVFLIITR